jgi:hypothetical protein
MKQVIHQATAAVELLAPTSAFAGPANTCRPINQFGVHGARHGPVEIVGPVRVATGANRHLGQPAVAVLDDTGNALANVSSTLANDQGLWPVRAGETVAGCRPGTCTKDWCAQPNHIALIVRPSTFQAALAAPLLRRYFP